MNNNLGHTSRTSFFNIINAHKFRSTADHRDSQRAIAATELLNTSIIAPVSITATLPIKLSQFLLSTHALFKPKITTMERTAHVIQATVSLAQTIMLAIIFLKGLECSNNNDNTILNCKILSLLGFIYNATLLAGWVPAEVGKEPYPGSSDGSITPPNTPFLNARFQTYTQLNNLSSIERQNSQSTNRPAESIDGSIESKHSETILNGESAPPIIGSIDHKLSK